jgi:hypothetical protein
LARSHSENEERQYRVWGMPAALLHEKILIKKISKKACGISYIYIYIFVSAILPNVLNFAL